MQRPLFMVALFYVAGLLTGEWLPWPPAWLFAFSLILLLLALIWRAARPVLIWPLLWCAGWTHLATRTAVLAPDDLRTLAGDRVEYVTLRGELLETPAQRVYEDGDRVIARTLAKLRVTGLALDNHWQSAFGPVAVSTPGELGSEFFAGQHVEVTGVIRRPQGAAAAGLFDYRAYLSRLGIHYQLRAESTNDWKVIQTPGSPDHPPLADRFSAWARETLRRGLADRDESVQLTLFMALGWRREITDEISEPFMRSGTMHIFAISGLHIALIAGILVNVLRVLRIPRGACGLIVIPLIWFYTAATGWQASAVRSTIMMTIVIGSWTLKRPLDLLNSLAGAAFLILVWDPQQLFQASFQLSFFVVLSIALLLPPLEQWRQGLLRPDPLLPPELRPRWQRWLDAPVRFVTTSLATSLAAWLGSLPLIAHYFHLCTPVSLLANLLIVPLSGFALMSHLGSLLCGDWLPGFGVLFNHSGWFWMNCMVAASEWTASLPAAWFHVRSPTPAGFLIYYTLLFGTLNGWLFSAGRRRWTFIALGLLSAWLCGSWWRHRHDVRITVLALRSGDAIFVDAPGRADDALIDCGNESSVEFVVKPFLRAQGVNHLAQLLLTHGDLHHIGGASHVISNFAVPRVWISQVRFRSRAYRDLLRQLESAPVSLRPVGRGDCFGAWTVLHPPAVNHHTLADDNALVLRGEFNGVRVLLCSDLGRRGQNDLLELGRDLRADIVVAGVPAREEPLNDAMLDAIEPKAIIISAGEYPASERATEPLRGRLIRRGTPVFYTDQEGAVTLVLRPGKREIQSMSGRGMVVPKSEGAD